MDLASLSPSSFGPRFGRQTAKPSSIHVIPEVEHASARPLPFNGSAGTPGAILACTMKEMKHVALNRCSYEPSSVAMDSCASCAWTRTWKSKSMERGLRTMHPGFTISRTSVRFRGKAIPGAEDRQKNIPGFDQGAFSQSHVLCIGAGGIVSMIAPTLVRKGIGRITLLDDDIVEASNLNRQCCRVKLWPSSARSSL